ncbi:2-isopropylmalate synthase [Clostridium bowmanii]|uniref:2-isopropylmalate synthase n=1 Tax=Clostridium bowmanii TaxID=132925 RepID=UPI001C0CEA6A|nr:2-isopropylmalate synthase [Clostridium bowmanii]MBU3189069.1 2-isopropylmalate synthase [Clostridium bowmanii]MCA1073829.1 2-isopropylmalate synthase [Clostridium bowmanii]
MKKVHITNHKDVNKTGILNLKVNQEQHPKLFKDIFPYSEIPKMVFGSEQIPMCIPEDIWITDTTFRDGQQAMDTYTEEQIIRIFDYLHKLDNNSGIIRQTEFFLYTEKDRNAARKCLERGYRFPEVTSWIRANKEDFKLVVDMCLKETGMLMSCSDYHIFKKLNKTRQQAMDLYISLVEESLENGIAPRCHLEDITRADFFGFVIPLVQKLMELSKKSGIEVKIRACDTLGLGLPYSGTELPRSVQHIINGLRVYGGVPSEYLEWHGHNDFYNVVPNATTAWLHGCSAINTSLFGIGERTGNCPLEAMIIEYGQLKGNVKEMDLKLISEIVRYFEGEFKYSIPPRTPFVGSEFNVTRAGIHADGILKDEEIYNIFDTEKILGRPIVVAVNEHSGHAGITAWINTYFRLKETDKIDKKDARIQIIKEWVDEQYMGGRNTVMKSDELELIAKQVIPELSLKAQDTKAC